MKFHAFPAAFALLIAAVPQANAGEVIAPGAEVRKLADGFKFTEGPAADEEGNVYFTDQPNDRILKWDLEEGLSTFLQPCGRSNGLYFDKDGNLLACADEKNQLWSIAPDKTVTVLVKDYEGKLLNGPNDLWVHPDGSVYFTDPLYTRPYWDRGPMEQDGKYVYRLSPDRKTPARAAEGFEQPNGIIGTPDGKTLYVADIGAKKTYRFDIGDDGSLSNKTLFCESGSDGMTIDERGNVYLTGDGVLVFNPEGEQIEHIKVDERWTANVTFGGPGFKTLFVTASQGLYALDMAVRGAGRL